MTSASRPAPDCRPVVLVNDPEFMVDPFDAYAQWREAGPVHRVRTPDGTQVWLVTRYADVRAALTDPILSLNRKNARPGGYHGFSLPPSLDVNLLNLDPPDHTRLRRLVSAAFTRTRIEDLRPLVQQHTDALIGNLAATNRPDLISAFAAPLPIAVISDLLGIPADSREDFRSWTNTLIAPDTDRPSAAKEALAAMLRFLSDRIAAKRDHPRDDLLSAMLQARDEHDHLSEDELLSLAFLLLWAGYENSVHVIGNASLALLTHPEQAAPLRAGLPLTSYAVGELLRFADPNQYAIRRFPTEDIHIGGVMIPAGDTVLLSLAAANRDPRRFPDPETLDLTRVDNPHLSFGAGIHFCLGAPLARLEAEIAVGAIFRRFPDIALTLPADKLRWRPSFRSRSLHELPVTLTPDPA